MKKLNQLCAAAIVCVLLFTIHSHGESIFKTIERSTKKMSGKIVGFFQDPSLGSVHYYSSMADNAAPVKEQIAGELFINAVYYKHFPEKARAELQKVATKTGISQALHKLNHTQQIKKFIQKYKIDMTDYAREKADAYGSFDEFFYRPLKANVRKIDTRPTAITAVADCKLRALENIKSSSKFFIKQHPFDLSQFLNDKSLAQSYHGGTMLVFRLAPTDYHRFHFPFDCTPTKPVLIPGKYETVSPIAFREGIWPISINKRARITLDSPEFGSVIMVVVGAAIVGSLHFTYTPNSPIKKGTEAGYFSHGGSTICLLFEKNTIALPETLRTRSNNIKASEKLTAQAANYEKTTAFETAVRVGQGVAMKAGSPDINLLSSPQYVAFLDKANINTQLIINDIKIPFAFNS